jgi:hypothetical protein
MEDCGKAVNSISAVWEKRIQESRDRQEHNPFSDQFVDTLHLHKGDKGGLDVLMCFNMSDSDIT